MSALNPVQKVRVYHNLLIVTDVTTTIVPIASSYVCHYKFLLLQNGNFNGTTLHKSSRQDALMEGYRKIAGIVEDLASEYIGLKIAQYIFNGAITYFSLKTDDTSQPKQTKIDFVYNQKQISRLYCWEESELHKLHEFIFGLIEQLQPIKISTQPHPHPHIFVHPGTDEEIYEIVNYDPTHMLPIKDEHGRWTLTSDIDLVVKLVPEITDLNK